jgi:hypothetical protein
MIKSVALLLALLAVAAAAVAINLPRVAPADSEAIYNTITSFDRDHPEWRLLSKKRIDATPIYFEHQVHMNPATPKMQETLQNRLVQPMLDAGVDPSLIPVHKSQDGQLVLACTACHQPDESGAYMKPIRFDNHCVACHALGSDVPHGSAIAPYIDRRAGEAALGVSAKPAAAAAPPAKGPARGPAGPRGAAAPAAPKPVTFESQDKLNEALAAKYTAERNKLYGNLMTNSCIKCHKQIPELRQQAGGDWTKIDWAQVGPRIPDRWLPRSDFDHRAHRMMACIDCHADAAADAPGEAKPRYPDDDDPASPASKLAWTGRTRQIMMPDIASCRECHSVQGNTRFDCVMCHSFHAPDVAPDHGGAFAGPARPVNPHTAK